MALNGAFRCRWILDGSGTVWSNHSLVFREGRIEALAKDDSEGETDLGEALITPGLVNPHIHLDLTHCPRQPAEGFAQWVRQVIAHRLVQTPAQVTEAIRDGVNQCLDHGVTLVGDISATGASWEVLDELGLRATIYFECLGLAPSRVETTLDRFETWLSTHAPTTTLIPGISPHAPYSTHEKIYRYAAATGLPIATHLAESAEEMTFLETREGPLAQLLRDLQIDPDAAVAQSPQDIFDWVKSARFLALVHLNHAPLLGSQCKAPRQGWVHCPRTHQFFQHLVHPFRDCPESVTSVSLGTDGLSSNPDLNLWEEAREVRRRFPGIAPADLLTMITRRPAQILGWGNQTGHLEKGKRADFLVFRPARPGLDQQREPHEALFEGDWELAEVWVGGNKVRG